MSDLTASDKPPHTRSVCLSAAHFKASRRPCARPWRHRYGAWSTILLMVAGVEAGCVGPPLQARTLELDPIEVRAGSALSIKLASMNAEELFAVGTAAHARGDFEQAAMAFETLLAAHPDSPRAADASYNAGISWERMGESLRALEHFDALFRRQSGRVARQTALRAAEALYNLEAFARASQLLLAVADDPSSSPGERIEGLVKAGVCLQEAGQLDEAERRLRQALGRYQLEERRTPGSMDPYFVAQGQFFLGEVYRTRFERAVFDPTASLEILGTGLASKGALLLSAQGHYLRAIRLGEAKWAAASGFELGQMYETFHAQILAAQLPLQLRDPNERLAYQQLLAKEVRALLGKALTAYERTLSAATRIGVRGRWKDRIEAGLDRVRSLLLDLPAEPDPSLAPDRSKSARPDPSLSQDLQGPEDASQ